MVSSDRIRGKVHTLKHRKFPLSIRKHSESDIYNILVTLTINVLQLF